MKRKYKYSKEIKRRLSENHKGSKNGMYGKHSWNYLGISKEYLEEKYIKENLSARDIAKLKNCNFSVIFYWLRKFNIPIKKSIKDYPNKLKAWNTKVEGSKRYTKSGYWLIKINKKWIEEHRYIMEQYYGRKLNKNEIVHHINGIKNDNRIENLIIMNKKLHDKYGKNYIEILQERIRFLENKLKTGTFTVVGAQVA